MTLVVSDETTSRNVAKCNKVLLNCHTFGHTLLAAFADAASRNTANHYQQASYRTTSDFRPIRGTMLAPLKEQQP